MASAIKATYGDEVIVTITADKFYSETTSFAAGGLWEVCVCAYACVLYWSTCCSWTSTGWNYPDVCFYDCVFSPICSEIRRMS